MKQQLITARAATLLAALVVTGMAAAAQAQSEQANETTTTLENVTAKDAPVKKEGEQDVDEVITNRKLRAETGAKSKFSFSAALGYNGGTVNSPTSDTRPNISSGTATPTVPAMSGSLGVKYKMSALQSLALDVGVTSRKPFHGDDKKSLRDRTTVSNPGLTYQTVYQAAGIQNVSAVSVGLYTDEFYRELGYQSSIGFSQTAIYDFGGSNFAVGMAFDAGYNTFDKNDDAVKSEQSDYSFAFYPFAEYVINDKLNLRTVFRPWIYEHARTEPFGNVIRNVYTQSVGLGISVTRDVYLYPNVQFVPLDLRSELTNVGLSANINI